MGFDKSIALCTAPIWAPSVPRTDLDVDLVVTICLIKVEIAAQLDVTIASRLTQWGSNLVGQWRRRWPLHDKVREIDHVCYID
eukprot:scaffold30_cov416-Prasinococcus_capsulatus_cf.AAC.9